MIKLPNISPLPFYHSMKERYDMIPYVYGDRRPLITKMRRIPQFQFVVDTIDGLFALTDVSFVDANTNVVIASIKDKMVDNGLSLKKVDGVYYLIYKNLGEITELDREGQFYLVVTFSKRVQGRPVVNERYYSDIFYQQRDVSNCIHLLYKDTNGFLIDNNRILFDDGFMFEVYIDSLIGKPSYMYEEEGTKRGGVFFRDYQISKKRYGFTFIAPEYLCDAIRIVPICDTVVITQGDNTYDPIQVKMDFDWQDTGALAAVNVEFDVNNIITATSGSMQNI